MINGLITVILNNKKWTAQMFRCNVVVLHRAKSNRLIFTSLSLKASFLFTLSAIYIIRTVLSFVDHSLLAIVRIHRFMWCLVNVGFIYLEAEDNLWENTGVDTSQYSVMKTLTQEGSSSSLLIHLELISHNFLLISVNLLVIFSEILLCIQMVTATLKSSNRWHLCWIF